MYCQKCGLTNKDASTFCSGCGGQLAPFAPVQQFQHFEPHRGNMILGMGIASWFCCGLFVGIPAWVMGKGDLAKIAAGRMDPQGEGNTKAGMILGMLCTLVTGGVLVLYLLMAFILAVVAVADSSG